MLRQKYFKGRLIPSPPSTFKVKLWSCYAFLRNEVPILYIRSFTLSTLTINSSVIAWRLYGKNSHFEIMLPENKTSTDIHMPPGFAWYALYTTGRGKRHDFMIYSGSFNLIPYKIRLFVYTRSKSNTFLASVKFALGYFYGQTFYNNVRLLWHLLQPNSGMKNAASLLPNEISGHVDLVAQQFFIVISDNSILCKYTGRPAAY